MPVIATPVLQSQSAALAGLRSSPLALITPSKKKGLFYRSSRNEQQLETSLLSLSAAEEVLHDSESGSVIAFVHSEPCQTRGSSTGSRRHHLYVSFKYRQSLIHYAYYHVHLKANGREARRAIFHAEKKEHFDTVCELFTSFIPTLRNWLSAIVKAANFIDQPVESVDLKSELKSRHHLILTRRTAVAASVVLCKLDPETKKIVSTSIVFDFKTQRIRDDRGETLRSFHEVFQQFLGLHHGNPLLPSPREEDEEEPLATGLLQGLEVDASPKTKLRRLLRLQGVVRGQEQKPEFLELMATILLPQLMDIASRHPVLTGASHVGPATAGDIATGSAVGSSTSAVAGDSAGGIGSGGRSLPGDLALEAPFDEIQVLICDILADICDLRVESVGPHVWRMCSRYLEDPGNWFACLATLAMLTLMSRPLAGWLVHKTDAAVRLISVFVESHQLLVSQHEAAMSAAGRGAPQQLPPRPYQNRSGESLTGGPRFLGRSSEYGPPMAPMVSDSLQLSRRGMAQTATQTLPGTADSSSGRNLHLDWLNTGYGSSNSTNRVVHRAPSFDNFEDQVGHTGYDELGASVGNITTISDYEDGHSHLRRRPGDFSLHEDSAVAGIPAPIGMPGSAEARNARPVRVPPLNLDLASRLPITGMPTVMPPENASSMTRSSRRLRHRQMQAGPLHPQPNPNMQMGTSARPSPSSRLGAGPHSHSMPSIGLRFMNSCLPSHAATPPSSSGTPLSTQVEMQSLQQSNELAKALGEACLLADLSHLIKYKQERQVQEAVMDRVNPGFCSPMKPSSCNVTPRTAAIATQGQSRQTPSSPQVGSASAKTTASPADGLLRSRESAADVLIRSRGDAADVLTRSRPPVPGMVQSHSGATAAAAGTSVATSQGAVFVSGGNASTSAAQAHPASHPTSAYDRQGRLIALRRVRLHASLVLERFCMNARRPASILGPYVPANTLFEMLQAACSRLGGCSFALDDDDGEDLAAVSAISSSSARSSDANDARQPRGWLEQRLSAPRLQRFSGVQERLNRSSTAFRCVCGASAVRSGPVEDLCTCVDDILASCIWQMLRVRAMHVQELQTVTVPAPCFHMQDPLAANFPPHSWDRSGNAWNVRLGLDAFLLRIQRSLQQILLQLRSAQSTTTAGPEVVASLQHRLAFLLKMCSAYLRHCCSHVLPMQVFQTVNPVLSAVKNYLCSAVEIVGSPPLPAPAVRLWVAYLQLVGILIRSIQNSGVACTAFGKVLLDALLDFSLSNPAATITGPTAAGGSTPVCTPPVARSGAASPAPSRPGSGSHAPPRRSASLRSLHNKPPHLPGSAHGSSISSPRSHAQQERSPSTQKQHSTARTETLSVCEYLPRIFERVLCDDALDDALSVKPRCSAGGEDNAETIRCRLLSFVEALLVFTQAIASSCRGASSSIYAEAANHRKPQSGASAVVAAGDVSGDSDAEKRSATLTAQPSVVTLGVHEGFRTTMALAAEPLVRGLLNWFQFLFLPRSGILCRLARRLPLNGGPVVARLLLCERALFRVPMVSESIYVCEAQIADYYVRRHFLAFVRLYNTRYQDEGSARKNDKAQINRLCCLHLQTLLAVASLQTEAELPRRAFHQLSVLDFLAGEVDLEHETTQMRDRFMRGAAQRQMSRQCGSAASDNGSCTSSPSNAPTGGRSAASSLGHTNAYHFPRVTPPLPLANLSEQSTEDLGNSSPSIESHTSSAAGARFTSGPPPTTKKFVPKLQLRGLRPSLQGCSGLGAPPPEEPMPVPQPLGASASSSAPPQPKQIAAALPKVPTQVANQAGTASPLGADTAEPPRRPPPVVPTLPIGAHAPGAAVAGTEALPGADLVTTNLDDPGDSVALEAQKKALQEKVASNIALRPSETEATAAVAGPASEADSSSEASSPAGSARQNQAVRMAPPALAPAAAPPVAKLPPVPSLLPPGVGQRPLTPLKQPPGSSAVPRLSFNGLRPSLQGCSGLGAPPPEEPGLPPSLDFGLAPSVMMGQPAANASSFPALAQAQSAPLSPPPPSDSDSDSSSDAPALKDQKAVAAGAETSATQALDSSDDESGVAERPQVAAAQAAASQEEEDGYDSSDEEEQATGSTYGTAPASLGHLRQEKDEEDCNVRPSGTADVPLLPPMPDLHGDGHLVQVVGGYKMPPALSGLPGAKSVPKLSFTGLRPSLQGCSGLGAPPPEEPTVEVDKQLAAATLTATTLPAPLQMNQFGESTEMAASTPTGSGYHSPMAGSSSSIHIGGEVDLSCVGVVHQNIFYFEGRQRRRIYEDVELHALMLTLILALLLTPKRGLLDLRYVDQYPFANHKRNVPFLLSLHLNHGANRNVLPCLSQQVETISHIGGFRLLKLLCETAMHRWMYTNWSRIAGGSFGTVYQCSVQFSEPGLVAVKQIPKQTSIQDRCVFTDVFSEIACLDIVRFEDHVCQLFDYGVDESGYWIVMKYYPTTLKKWREALAGSVEDNLPALLCVYKQVLKAVHTLHRHGVIHYDLKCDNIMLDPERALSGDPSSIVLREAGGSRAPANSPRREEGREGAPEPIGLQRSPSGPVWPPVKEEEPLLPGELPGLHAHRGMDVPCIAVADFGESRMMSGSDELCVRNRGTELLKCPEMIELEKVCRTEGFYYDRRKRVGTNQAADVWSLGCLLFELLTGRFLFQDDDFGVFWARVTGRMAVDIISEANCRLIDNNVPLLEFIRYVLVRDPVRRPSISAVMKKFESSAAEALRFSSRHNWHNEDIRGTLVRRDSATSLDSPHSVARSIGGSSGGGPHSRSDYPRPDRPLICAAAGEFGSHFTKVFHDLCVLEVSEEDLHQDAWNGGVVSWWCDDTSVPGVDVRNRGMGDAAIPRNAANCARGNLRELLAHHLWTHIVDFRVAGAQRLPFQEEVHYKLDMPWSSSSTNAEDFLCFLPTLFDFLRHAAITRGVVLLVDGYSAAERMGAAAGESSCSVAAEAPPGHLAEPGTTERATGSSSAGRGGLAMAAVLAVVTEIYSMAVFPALSHLSSQLLVAAVRPDVVAAMARWQESERRAASRRREGTIRIACFCGSCSWHVPAKWLLEAQAVAAASPEPSTIWPGPHARLVSCTCNPKSSVAQRCPSHGNCESYVRWLRARFGVTSPNVRWLWLPEGVDAHNYSDDVAGSVLTRGLKAQAEPVVELGRRQDDTLGRSQRFRCRSCQVLTHAEIYKAPSRAADPLAELPSEPPRVALVCTYEVLRCSMSSEHGGARQDVLATSSSDLGVSAGSASRPSRRPPARFRDVHLEEVMLPPAQPHVKNLL